MAQLREEIDAFRLTYEHVLAEDKKVQNDFRKEVADSPVGERMADVC